MNLRNILNEMSDDIGGNSKGTRRKNNIAISTTTTPLEQVEAALMNLNNYKDAGEGQFVTYQRNADPSINPIIQKAFGPGGGPNMKILANKKEWNSADREWRLKKAKDIQSRTGLDITGWEDINYDELPKEATDWRIFYPQSSIDAMVPIILGITQDANILHWEEEDGALVFPRKKNTIIPGDDTMEKILNTVLKNAGIEDATIGRKTEEEGPITKKVSKFTQIRIPLDTRGDVAEVRKELQAKFMLPQAAYETNETEDGFELVIRNITILQKANIQSYLQDEDLLERLNEEMRQMLVRAGIIK